MPRLSRQVLLNVPNVLTYCRMGVIPILIILLGIQGPRFSFETNAVLSQIAALFFVLAGVSDIIDGYYARKYKMVSIFGKFLDPIADKLIHMTAMVMMIPLGRLPAWIVVLLLFREIFISGLRSVAAAEGMIIDAGEKGKKKTALLNCGLTAIMIHDPLFGINALTVGWFCLTIGAVYSLLSGMEYTVAFLKYVKK